METGLREYEGTWEELAVRAPNWAGKRLHVTILPAENDAVDPRLRILNEIEERSRFMNPAVDDRDHLREGRNGAMFGE